MWHSRINAKTVRDTFFLLIHTSPCELQNNLNNISIRRKEWHMRTSYFKYCIQIYVWSTTTLQQSNIIRNVIFFSSDEESRGGKKKRKLIAEKAVVKNKSLSVTFHFLAVWEINALFCSSCITIPSYLEMKNRVLNSFFTA